MGEELIPCPLLRFPCLYQDDDSRPTLCEALFKFNEFETTRKFRVVSPVFGTCRIVASLFCVVGYGYYAFIMEKSYLEKATSDGFARISIQHPVLDCNPIDAACEAHFTPREDLYYCPDLSTSVAGGFGEHAVGCVYLDEYDVFMFDSGADNSQFMIPTRISTITQTLDNNCQDEGCVHPYTIASVEHNFVADIENYTLLIDHSFICQDNAMVGDSNTVAGFVRMCFPEGSEPEGETEEEVEEVEMEECPTYSINNGGHIEQLEEIEAGYGASGHFNGILSLPIGDIIKFSDLLRIAGVDLNSTQGEGAQAGTVRYEGEVVIIEIHYENYKEGHLPNSLPPVYEYFVYRLPAKTYKMTKVDKPNAATRIVTDIHGIHVEVRVMGKMGKLSVARSLMTLIEIVAFLGVLNWILTCCAFNAFPGKPGDDFYNEVHKEYDVSKHDGLAIYGNRDGTESDSEGN